MWNGKGKLLKNTTQNYNRVFRSKDVIDEIGNENLNYLKDISKLFNHINYHYDGNHLAQGLLLSLKPGGEIIYTLAHQLANSEDDINTKMIRNLTDARDILISSMSKVNYKNMLKILGLTKADIKNENYKSVNFGLDILPSLLNKEIDGTDFSKGSIVEHPYWQNTPKGYLSMVDTIYSLSEQYGYSESFSWIAEKVRYSIGYNLNNILANFRDNNIKVNLEKMMRYFYIDVFSHQGFQGYSNVISTYADYINLVVDIPGFVVYPKYLAVAHDIASKAKVQSSNDEGNVINVTEKLANVESIYRVKDSDGNIKSYPVVVLRAGNEIRHEATNQSNCLAGYIKTVASGKSIILSLKDPDEWENNKKLKSFVSVEVRMPYPGSNFDTPYLGQAFKTYNNMLDNKDMGVLMAIMKRNNIDVTQRITGFGVATEQVQNNAKIVKVTELKENTHPTIEKELKEYYDEKEQGKQAQENLASYIGRL